MKKKLEYNTQFIRYGKPGFRLIRIEIFNWGTSDGGENNVWQVIPNFQNLDNSHMVIIKAGLQLERLDPVVEIGKNYESLQNEQTILESLDEIAGPWFANRKNLLLNKAIVINRNE